MRLKFQGNFFLAIGLLFGNVKFSEQERLGVPHRGLLPFGRLIGKYIILIQFQALINIICIFTLFILECNDW